MNAAGDLTHGPQGVDRFAEVERWCAGLPPASGDLFAELVRTRPGRAREALAARYREALVGCAPLPPLPWLPELPPEKPLEGAILGTRALDAQPATGDERAVLLRELAWELLYEQNLPPSTGLPILRRGAERWCAPPLAPVEVTKIAREVAGEVLAARRAAA